MFLTFNNFRKRLELGVVSHFINKKEFEEKCRYALKSGVGVICVDPIYVKFAKSIIGEQDVNLSSNVGFPSGTHLTKVKVLEAEEAVKDGADQIDMVMNIGALRSGDYDEALNDIKAVVNAAPNCIIKVIIEAWVLNHDEKVIACRLIEEAGAHLLKTTTGLENKYITEFTHKENLKGATIEDIKLFRKTLSPKMRIKAAGGVQTLDDAFAMIKAGADQLGASKSLDLVNEFKKRYIEGVEI